MSKKTIYVISVFERMDLKFREWDPQGSPIADIGCKVINGWYLKKDKAVDIVVNNKSDLWETCYDFAVIEECTEGMYDFFKEKTYYKYNRDNSRYELLESDNIPGIYKSPEFSISGIGC